MNMTVEQNLVQAVPSNRREASIGKLLLDMGKISPEDAERILRLQKDENLRFGDAAQKLGLITEADIRQALSLQFDYPYLQPGQGKFDPQLVAAYQPFSTRVEGLRALRSQLMLRWFDDVNKSLAIVAANPGEGAQYLAANLAVVFSQLGENTLLVDANMRAPSQQAIFNLPGGRGLSDILAERAGMEVITRIESFIGLSVLGAGTVPPNPQELLGRPSFVNFMAECRKVYDVVIVDTPPALENSDAQSISGRCGGALLVARLNHTVLSELALVCEQIKVTGAQIVGSVINEF
jgi:chain length determinant protein tyrosine kinase EpsG